MTESGSSHARTQKSKLKDLNANPLSASPQRRSAPGPMEFDSLPKTSKKLDDSNDRDEKPRLKVIRLSQPRKTMGELRNGPTDSTVRLRVAMSRSSDRHADSAMTRSPRASPLLGDQDSDTDGAVRRRPFTRSDSDSDPETPPDSPVPSRLPSSYLQVPSPSKPGHTHANHIQAPSRSTPASASLLDIPEGDHANRDTSPVEEIDGDKSDQDPDAIRRTRRVRKESGRLKSSRESNPALMAAASAASAAALTASAEHHPLVNSPVLEEVADDHKRRTTEQPPHPGSVIVPAGTNVRLTSAEYIHPKMKKYANTNAKIFEVPVHPNTWYGISLWDGTIVSLRRTQFEVLEDRFESRLDRSKSKKKPKSVAEPKPAVVRKSLRMDDTSRHRKVQKRKRSYEEDDEIEDEKYRPPRRESVSQRHRRLSKERKQARRKQREEIERDRAEARQEKQRQKKPSSSTRAPMASSSISSRQQPRGTRVSRSPSPAESKGSSRRRAAPKRNEGDKLLNEYKTQYQPRPRYSRFFEDFYFEDDEDDPRKQKHMARRLTISRKRPAPNRNIEEVALRRQAEELNEEDAGLHSQDSYPGLSLTRKRLPRRWLVHENVSRRQLERSRKRRLAAAELEEDDEEVDVYEYSVTVSESSEDEEAESKQPEKLQPSTAVLPAGADLAAAGGATAASPASATAPSAASAPSAAPSAIAPSTTSAAVPAPTPTSATASPDAPETAPGPPETEEQPSDEEPSTATSSEPLGREDMLKRVDAALSLFALASPGQPQQESLFPPAAPAAARQPYQQPAALVAPAQNLSVPQMPVFSMSPFLSQFLNPFAMSSSMGNSLMNPYMSYPMGYADPSAGFHVGAHNFQVAPSTPTPTSTLSALSGGLPDGARETKTKRKKRRIFIIGGGVVGCALARNLSFKYDRDTTEITVIERCETGAGISGNCSGFLAAWAVPSELSDFARVGFSIHETLSTNSDYTECGYRRLDAVAASRSADDSAQPPPPALSPSAGGSGGTTPPWLNGTRVRVEGVPLGDKTNTMQVLPRKLTKRFMRDAKQHGVRFIQGAVSRLEMDGELPPAPVEADSSSSSNRSGSPSRKHPPKRGRVRKIVFEDGRQFELRARSAMFENSLEDIVICTVGVWTTSVLKGFDLPPVTSWHGNGLVLKPSAPLSSHAVYLDYHVSADAVVRTQFFPRPDGQVYACSYGEAQKHPHTAALVCPDEKVVEQIHSIAKDVSRELAEATVMRRHGYFYPLVRDQLPLLGKIPNVSNAYIATAFGPHSVLLGPAVGVALSELILTGTCPIGIKISAYDPARFLQP